MTEENLADRGPVTSVQVVYRDSTSKKVSVHRWSCECRKSSQLAADTTSDSKTAAESGRQLLQSERGRGSLPELTFKRSVKENLSIAAFPVRSEGQRGQLLNTKPPIPIVSTHIKVRHDRVTSIYLFIFTKAILLENELSVSFLFLFKIRSSNQPSLF